MPHDSSLAELHALVDSETARLRTSFLCRGNFDSRVALIELSRAIDYFYTRRLLTSQANPEDLANLYSRGISMMLALFADECLDKPGVPLACSTDKLQEWSHSCIQHAGRLSYLSHLLELVGDGFFILSKVGKARFEFRWTQEFVDLEAFDVADQVWVRDLIAEADRPLMEKLSEQFPLVLERMRAVVYPWRKEFIGYESDPEVDAHFDTVGIGWARALDGQIELPGEAFIGGHPFYTYRAAVALMCGRALKHTSFAADFSMQRPDLNPHNMMSVWSPRQTWSEFFQGCLEVDVETANDLLDSLTLDLEYKEQFGSVSVAPAPPLIQVGRNDLLMSICGCLDAPFHFLLRKLRHRFRSDWDKIVGQREKHFRDELYTLFALDRILTVDRPVRIRRDGRDVTDIDAVAFDRDQGTLLLFQLKWQDPFGQSLRERRSRMRNFMSTSNKWVDTISEWLSQSSREQLLDCVGLDTSRFRINRIEIVVLARHHARFTKSDAPATSAAWGTWPQLCRIASEEYRGGDLLGLLADRLREEQERVESPRPRPIGTMRIGQTEIALVPTRSSGESADVGR